jgi:hypothetical protein
VERKLLGNISFRRSVILDFFSVLLAMSIELGELRVDPPIPKKASKKWTASPRKKSTIDKSNNHQGSCRYQLIVSQQPFYPPL